MLSSCVGTLILTKNPVLGRLKWHFARPKNYAKLMWSQLGESWRFV
jgi:hypothetical protein